MCIREESQSGPIISAMSAKSGPVVSAVRVLGRVHIFGRYLWVVGCGYVKFLVKKNKPFGWKHFLSIEKWDSTSFRQIFWPEKWDLRERYGGPNLGEKDFQLFQLL